MVTNRDRRYELWREPEAEDARDNPKYPMVITDDDLLMLPKGFVYISRFIAGATRNQFVTRYTLTLVGGEDWPANQTTVTTVNERIADEAERAWHTKTPVLIRTVRTQFGYDVLSIDQGPSLSWQTPRHHHLWDWASATVLKCRRCGLLHKAER